MLALSSLSRLGYTWVGSSRPYDLFLTPSGQKKVKLYFRTCRDDGRYPIGIAPNAMEDCDEIVFWASGEDDIYIIDSKWLLDFWNGAGKPISSQNQFYFNLHWNEARIETPERHIGQFCRRIPPEAPVREKSSR